MKDSILLNIRGIQYSQSRSGSYALILEDSSTQKHLPVIIGGTEAQAIALGLEKDLNPTRPLTHDLFINALEIYEVHVKGVHIHKLEDGVFFSDLMLELNGELKHIDSRTSDAVAMAVRANAPIYASKQVMTEAGIHLSDIAEEEEEVEEAISQIEEELIDLSEEAPKEQWDNYSDKELHTMMDSAVKDEDYERAAKIRDVLEKRKNT